MNRMFLGVAFMAVGLVTVANVQAASFTVDLTHPIPTFHPMEGDAMKADMAKPWLDSKAIPSFGQQTVLSFGKFPTNQGHFDLGTLVISEHHGNPHGRGDALRQQRHLLGT